MTTRDKALAAVRAKIPGYVIDPRGLVTECVEAAYEAGVAEKHDRAQHYDKVADDMRAEIERLKGELHKAAVTQVTMALAAIRAERERCQHWANMAWSAYTAEGAAKYLANIETGEPALKETP